MLGGVRDDYWTQYQLPNLLQLRDHFGKGRPAVSDIAGAVAAICDGPLYIGATVATVVLLAWLFRRAQRAHPPQGYAAAVPAIAVLVATAELFPLANLQWAVPPYGRPPPVHAGVAALRDAFSRPRDPRSVMVVDSAMAEGHFGINVMDDWGFKAHVDNFRRYFDREGRPLAGVDAATLAAVRHFYGADDAARQVFFTARIDHRDPVGFVADAEASERRAAVSIDVAVAEFDGNGLTLTVRSREAGWISYIDNDAEGWHATINGAPVAIVPLLGAYKSVPVPAGVSAVVFRYAAW
jgi:hypothetical protein